MTITLTEQQRTKSIAMSGTRGGDGEALILSSIGSMAKDIAQNPTVEDLDVNFVELNDTEHPSIINAALNLSNGVLTLNAAETLDFTPSRKGDLSLISIVNHVEGARCTSCSSGINNADRVACTGITGNTFTASTCSNDHSHDSNRSACEAGGGSFAPATCAHAVLVEIRVLR